VHDVRARAVSGVPDERAGRRDLTMPDPTGELLQLKLMALDTAANAIAITDGDGVMVWVNPAFTRLTGFAPDEAVGRTLAIL
jgi:PAS domain-containing protein